MQSLWILDMCLRTEVYWEKTSKHLPLTAKVLEHCLKVNTNTVSSRFALCLRGEEQQPWHLVESLFAEGDATATLGRNPQWS